jgi:hypothetical protein
MRPDREALYTGVDNDSGRGLLGVEDEDTWV